MNRDYEQGVTDGFCGVEPQSMDDDYLNGHFRGCEIREKEDA
jgi:hypothetical protein